MQVANSRTFPAGDVFRARLILALAAVRLRSHCSRAAHQCPTIARWKRRFDQNGIDGLVPCHRGSPVRVATAGVQARVLKKPQQEPPTAAPTGRAARWPKRWG